ncbi:hypothetical protein BFJ72_g14948 [Fusarium proliferatum]|uniref:Uncharacterized protein n=1 Tax=Gibberella intermedia TaxID=948311 RepID=A0A420RV78_GIBIN|nr:hypothetical protein BFJ72_g14948 [Fusarium proliferatum]
MDLQSAHRHNAFQCLIPVDRRRRMSWSLALSDKTLLECEYLLDSAPACAALHAKGDAIPPAFMWDKPGPVLSQALNQRVAEIDDAFQGVGHGVQTLIDSVKGARPESATDRLSFLLRYVDTKRLIRRLTHVLGLRDSREFKWTLSAIQRSQGRRPAEFEMMLNNARERYGVC